MCDSKKKNSIDNWKIEINNKKNENLHTNKNTIKKTDKKRTNHDKTIPTKSV